jgi:hypothetical protein
LGGVLTLRNAALGRRNITDLNERLEGWLPGIGLSFGSCEASCLTGAILLQRVPQQKKTAMEDSVSFVVVTFHIRASSSVDEHK